MNRTKVLALISVFAWLWCPAGRALGDWPQFRGVNSAGHADQAVPIEFGPGKNELWSVSVGQGHSSPCVVGDRVFVTSGDVDTRELAVMCLDRRTGTVLWRHAWTVDHMETGHPSFHPASSSPATDGEIVVAYFGSFGLVAFDVGGEKRWEAKLPLPKSYAGNATSPRIAGDKVILYRGNHVDHFLLALDKKTGETIWRVDQDEPFESELACTAVPIVHGKLLIVHSARALQAVDLDSGRPVWMAKCATTATSTPVISGNEVIVAAWNKMGEPALRPSFPSFDDLIEKHDADDDGMIQPQELPKIWIFHRPEGSEAPQNGAPLGFRRVDHNKDGNVVRQEWQKTLEGIEKFRANYETHGILAVPIDSQGMLTIDQFRTLENQGIPEVPSPLAFDGRIYFVKNGGVLTCLDQSTGERLSKIRTKGSGTHYASPIIAGDKLYSTSGDGRISVLSLGEKPKLIAVNEMGDRTFATPAADAGVLYVRTHQKLYAFGED